MEEDELDRDLYLVIPEISYKDLMKKPTKPTTTPCFAKKMPSNCAGIPSTICTPSKHPPWPWPRALPWQKNLAPTPTPIITLFWEPTKPAVDAPRKRTIPS